VTSNPNYTAEKLFTSGGSGSRPTNQPTHRRRRTCADPFPCGGVCCSLPLIPSIPRYLTRRIRRSSCCYCCPRLVGFRRKRREWEMMFWRDSGGTGTGSGRDSLSGGPPCGQVRVLVVGDSGQSVCLSLPHYLDSSSESCVARLFTGSAYWDFKFSAAGLYRIKGQSRIGTLIKGIH
jgi:hypothetical protein